MANCTNCGAALKDGLKFCTECGSSVAETKTAVPQTQTARPVQQPPRYQPPREPEPPRYQPQNEPRQTYASPQPPRYEQPNAVRANDAPPKGSPYAPITTWGFIGIMFLMSIPILGAILVIVWACGGCRKIQKRNMSRAILIISVIMLVLTLILGLIFGHAVKKLWNELEDQIVEAVENGELSDEDGGGLLSLLVPDSSNDRDRDSDKENGDISDLMDEVGKINDEASRNSNGWPKELPKYPDGTMNEEESYRTIITGTTAETMWAYIDTLKASGFVFQDFYGIGFTEADMKYMDAWWGTNGKLYLSISFYDGEVTVDHTTELPDLSGLLG